MFACCPGVFGGESTTRLVEMTGLSSGSSVEEGPPPGLADRAKGWFSKAVAPITEFKGLIFSG